MWVEDPIHNSDVDVHENVEHYWRTMSKNFVKILYFTEILVPGKFTAKSTGCRITESF